MLQLKFGLTTFNMVKIPKVSPGLATFLLILTLHQISTEKLEANQTRAGKFLSLFTVIQFQNALCLGSDGRNGTCFTLAECDQRGGNAGGSCASGFGVCCVFTRTCGQTVNTECAYLVQTRFSSLTTDCSYTICKSNPNICRIRLDFQSFDIAGPTTNELLAATTGLSAIGDCLSDSFSVTSPGGNGSPIICGFNTGQHMILDASDSCNVANFAIDPVGSGGQEWDIKVTQFNCMDDAGGPPGCLQYFAEPTGIVRSFAFRPSNTLGTDLTHISQQCYSMCFRQIPGMCTLCLTEESMNSFGLSAAISMALTDANCVTDYLLIPQAISPTPNVFVNRVCGTVFVAKDTGAKSEKVCTSVQPFIIQFKTDDTELDGERDAMLPTGLTGFSLKYAFEPCL